MRNVLIVDDNAVHRELVGDILREFCIIEVIEVATVPDAIAALEQMPEIDAIISDYKIDKERGDQFHRRILELIRVRKIKFIAMSGDFPDEVRHYFQSHDVPCVDKTSMRHNLLVAMRLVNLQAKEEPALF